MNDDTIWQLYPMPAQEVSLEGLYLRHGLRRFGEELGRPFVYTNYVVSIDGRIAITRPEGKGMIVSVWETEAAAADATGFAAGVLDEYMALFSAPPGREYYEVAFAEMPGVAVG